MRLFGKKNKKNSVQWQERQEVEEKVEKAEADMAYLEAQIRLFRKEQQKVGAN